MTRHHRWGDLECLDFFFLHSSFTFLFFSSPLHLHDSLPHYSGPGLPSPISHLLFVSLFYSPPNLFLWATFFAFDFPHGIPNFMTHELSLFRTLSICRYIIASRALLSSHVFLAWYAFVSADPGYISIVFAPPPFSQARFEAKQETCFPFFCFFFSHETASSKPHSTDYTGPAARVNWFRRAAKELWTKLLFLREKRDIVMHQRASYLCCAGLSYLPVYLLSPWSMMDGCILRREGYGSIHMMRHGFSPR